MGDLSRNFSRWEFECQCGCGYDKVDTLLVNVLQDARDFFKSAITITSGNRCELRNKVTPGAAKGSKHMYGLAADIKVDNIDAKTVFDYFDAKYPSRFGIGLYKNRVHIDVRPDRQRWFSR